MKKIIWIALLSVVFGCGGGVNVQPYVGNWTSVGNQIETCNTLQHTTSLNGVITITQGPSSGDLVTNPPNGCNLTWSVSGNTGTLKGSQTCTVPGSVGGIWIATFTSGSLSLSGSTITFSDLGTGLLNTGQTTQCTFTQSGALTKI